MVLLYEQLQHVECNGFSTLWIYCLAFLYSLAAHIMFLLAMSARCSYALKHSCFWFVLTVNWTYRMFIPSRQLAVKTLLTSDMVCFVRPELERQWQNHLYFLLHSLKTCLRTVSYSLCISFLLLETVLLTKEYTYLVRGQADTGHGIHLFYFNTNIRGVYQSQCALFEIVPSIQAEASTSTKNRYTHNEQFPKSG